MRGREGCALTLLGGAQVAQEILQVRQAVVRDHSVAAQRGPPVLAARRQVDEHPAAAANPPARARRGTAPCPHGTRTAPYQRADGACHAMPTGARSCSFHAAWCNVMLVKGRPFALLGQDACMDACVNACARGCERAGTSSWRIAPAWVSWHGPQNPSTYNGGLALRTPLGVCVHRLFSVACVRAMHASLLTC